jgi:hypothetical protein
LYDDKKLLVVAGVGAGESVTSVLQYDNQAKKFIKGPTLSCTDNDSKAKGGDSMSSTEVYTTNAMACRRASIKVNATNLNQTPAQLPAEPVQQRQPGTTQDVLVGTVTPVTTTVQKVEEKWVEKDNITKRVLRSLLSECNYFETIKEETPMVYDNLKEKLKFFQPAFHSMTPEGLNTRLTFLQQCMRPGDTIPTIKTVGQTNELQYNNAVNTAFGAPPVCVLRIGDFYNTKIIPTSLALTYEELDINPEGIGIQPMIANVTMGFNFVGGSGLKESVDKLQNALTFNYYANTEMYDERADVTDDSYKVIDKDFLKSIGAQPPPPTVNQTQDNNPQTNENTIGEVTLNLITTTGETGTINYKKYMDEFVAQTQTYFQTFVNKSKECVKQYNNAMLQNWTCERNYVKGKLLSDTAKDVLIIGKPANIQTRVDNIFNDYVADIESDDKTTQDRFINFMSTNKGFSPKVIRQLRMNLKNFVIGKKGSYQNAVSTLNQDITNQQQTYIQYLTRANVLPFEVSTGSGIGTDGLQQKNGNVKIYNISGTTKNVYKTDEAANTFIELEQDIKKIGISVSAYYVAVIKENNFTYGSKTYKGKLLYGDDGEQTTYEKYLKPNVFIPFSLDTEFDYKSFRRMYMILSPEITDDKRYQTFKNAIIGNIIKNTDILGTGSTDVEAQFDGYWLQIAKPKFTEENTITNTFIDNMEKGVLKDFIKYTPFPSKAREFTYEISTSPNDSQKDLINGLGRVLANTDKTIWNNEGKARVYVAKLKLN